MFEEIVIVMIGETAMRTTFVCAHTLGASRKAYLKRHVRSLATQRECHVTTGGQAE